MKILLTGAAGAVGAEVARDLARQGHAVLGMVNRTDKLILSNGKFVETCWGSAEAASDSRVTLFRGDITHPRFGLSQDDYDRLVSSIDMIVHSAALTEFGLPKNAYEQVNVVGTAHVLNLATKGRREPIRLVHISTAYVCGERQGDILEEDLDRGQSFGNHYEESKYRAELLVRQSMREGLEAGILRPSIVVGHSRTGMTRDFKTIYVALRVTTQGLVRSIPGNYDAKLDLIPIDYVASAVTTAVERFRAISGKTLHIVARNPVTLRDFSDVLAEYPTLHVPRFVPPHSFRPEKLGSIERKYYERILKVYRSYFSRNITFSNIAAIDLLQATLPPNGKPLIRRLINYCERVGYLGRPAPMFGGSPQ